jgi:hypothetical protein
MARLKKNGTAYALKAEVMPMDNLLADRIRAIFQAV